MGPQPGGRGARAAVTHLLREEKDKGKRRVNLEAISERWVSSEQDSLLALFCSPQESCILIDQNAPSKDRSIPETCRILPITVQNTLLISQFGFG